VIAPRGANVYDEPGNEEKEETGGQRSQYQYHVSDDLPDPSLRNQSTLPGTEVGSKQ
jgi:hypothetical protein